MQMKWRWFQLLFLWFCSAYRSLGQVKWDLLLVLLCSFGFVLLRALGFTTLLNMTLVSWEHLILFISISSLRGTQLRHGTVLGVVSCVQQVILQFGNVGFTNANACFSSLVKMFRNLIKLVILVFSFQG